MLIDLTRIFRIANDLEQIFVPDKIEAWEGQALRFEVVAQCFLDGVESKGFFFFKF